MESSLLICLICVVPRNMPGANQDVYVTTTLSGACTTTPSGAGYLSQSEPNFFLLNAVCIFTTIICGGMTEPLLTYTELKVRAVYLA